MLLVITPAGVFAFHLSPTFITWYNSAAWSCLVCSIIFISSSCPDSAGLGWGGLLAHQIVSTISRPWALMIIAWRRDVVDNTDGNNTKRLFADNFRIKSWTAAWEKIWWIPALISHQPIPIIVDARNLTHSGVVSIFGFMGDQKNVANIIVVDLHGQSPHLVFRPEWARQSDQAIKDTIFLYQQEGLSLVPAFGFSINLRLFVTLRLSLWSIFILWLTIMDSTTNVKKYFKFVKKKKKIYFVNKLTTYLLRIKSLF